MCTLFTVAHISGKLWREGKKDYHQSKNMVTFGEWIG